MLRYGTKNYSSDALKFLDQDFYGKFYAFEFGAYKEIETNASFYMIPRLKLSVSSEKNIYDNLPNYKYVDVTYDTYEKMGVKYY